MKKMLSEKDLHTHHYPSNPLPFEIVDRSCPDCEKLLYELNDLVEIRNSGSGDLVYLELQKDSAGRGWHIVSYRHDKNKRL